MEKGNRVRGSVLDHTLSWWHHTYMYTVLVFIDFCSVKVCEWM